MILFISKGKRFCFPRRVGDLTLFEALTGGAFDLLNCQKRGEFDQNFSKKVKCPGVCPGGGGWAVLELPGTLHVVTFAPSLLFSFATVCFLITRISDVKFIWKLAAFAPFSSVLIKTRDFLVTRLCFHVTCTCDCRPGLSPLSLLLLLRAQKITLVSTCQTSAHVSDKSKRNSKLYIYSENGRLLKLQNAFSKFLYYFHGLCKSISAPGRVVHGRKPVNVNPGLNLLTEALCFLV